jgi:GT2 family glycosyltransferase
VTQDLRIVAPFHNVSGYAKAARGLLAAALLAGLRVEAVESEFVETIDNSGRHRYPRYQHKEIPACQRPELQQALATTVPLDAPTLIMGNPGSMAHWEEYCTGPRIGYTMLESDTLQPQWAQACRNVDLLLAPSRWCLNTFCRDVEDTPTALLPICADERLWSPEGLKRMIAPEQPAFLFLSIFSTCERKGWRKTIQAFAEEFRGDNVGLVLKPTRATEVEELAEWAGSMGAKIYLVKGELADYEMACLYRACDVYVSPSAEGYGVPFVEAAMCGLPSVALDGGGAADIVSGSNGYPIPVEWESCVGQLPQIYPSSHKWPTCSVAALRGAMRRACSDASGHRLQRAENGMEDAEAKFSRKAIGKALVRVLADVSRERIEITIKERTHPLVAVITTHNHMEATRRLVASLRETVPGCSIILADDGSTDGTSDWADQSGLLILSCNTGGNVSRNRQVAIEYLKSCPGSPAEPFVVFLDNDIEVSGDWWKTLHEILEARPNIGVLSPRKRYGAGGIRGLHPRDGGEGAGDIQNIGNRIYFNGGSFPCFLERDLVYPDYVESACMVVRPQVWRRCAWDEQFPIFYEDVDYCFQAREAGFEVCATALATVTHHAHTTSHSRAAESEINRMRFLKKWQHRL